MVIKNFRKSGSLIALLCVAVLSASCNRDEEIRREVFGPHVPTDGSSPYCTSVFEYIPAPGQFINNGPMSGFSGGETTPEAAADYALARLSRGAHVSLGGFGGYIVVGFDHSIQNWGSAGGYDFSITGNQFSGSSEPGVVWVMQDSNADGEPNETWYQLRGALYDEQVHEYSVTYYRPEGPQQPVRWSDNIGGEGVVEYLSHNSQESYYPAWVTAQSYTLSGPCLPDNSFTHEGGRYDTGAYGWGYADNYSTVDMLAGSRNFFKISNAVDPEGNPVELKYIDFIKIQTAVNIQGGGGVGELSTEVLRIRDENLK